MWYGSNLSWGSGERQEEMSHLFKYAESADGLTWHRDGRIVLPFKDETEYAMSKPAVVRDPDMYRMWYSYRGHAYRIGYAESPDGLVWTRRDELAGIEPAVSDWDVGQCAIPACLIMKVSASCSTTAVDTVIRGSDSRFSKNDRRLPNRGAVGPAHLRCARLSNSPNFLL